MKKTKIVCTLGPSSGSVKAMTEMVKAGMNVARLNFSHGTHENHFELLGNIRKVSEKLKTPIAILQDLQGPKIRVMELAEPLSIKAGQELILGQDFFTDVPIVKFLKVSHRILIEDGIIELKVQKIINARKAKVLVVNGSKIQSHKGVNLPDSSVTFGSLTEKDKKDLVWGIKNGVDFIAISFVRTKRDVVAVQRLLEDVPSESRPKVIVKIERPEAVKNFDDILHVVDGVMVARGDLGVEIDMAQVPIVQKDIIRKCMEAAKPVIVATQMLDSMIRNPRPTRAEVSDVANAVVDRADAVMLSGESAFGKYPIEAVRQMAKIITSTEKSKFSGESCVFAGGKDEEISAQAAESACELSVSHKAVAIVSASHTTYAARFLARQRPPCEVFIASNEPTAIRQMTLFYGISPILLSGVEHLQDQLDQLIPCLRKLKLLKKGQGIVRVLLHGSKKQHALIDTMHVKNSPI